MEYYYNQGGQPVGPVDLDALRSVGLTPNTLVWHEGMTDWLQACELPELADLFPQAPVNPIQSNFPPTPQQPPMPQAQMTPSNEPMPPTYLVWAILTTILCFWPLGIAAIINASGVSSAFSRGDIETAKRRSKNAKLFSIWTAVIGFVLAVVLLIVWSTVIVKLGGNNIDNIDLEELYDL